MAALATPVSRDQARDRYRVEHGVRLVSEKDEGAAFGHLPNGVYGFTYAPATETPVFRRHSYHSYEVHKLADGSGRLIAWCAAEEAARFGLKGKEFDVTIYPEPSETAPEPVAIPFDWIYTSLYKPVRRDGNSLPLHIATPA